MIAQTGAVLLVFCFSDRHISHVKKVGGFLNVQLSQVQCSESIVMALAVVVYAKMLIGFTEEGEGELSRADVLIISQAGVGFCNTFAAFGHKKDAIELCPIARFRFV